MQERYIERILKARVYDVAIESPLEAAPRLSRRLGADLFESTAAENVGAMILGIALYPVFGLGGILFPLLLIADRVAPGSATRVLSALWVAPEALSGPYLAPQAVPVVALAILAIVVLASVYSRKRGLLAEAFEAFLDAEPGLERLRRGLWEIGRGAALSGAPASEAELGRRYVALLSENLGEIGFRVVGVYETSISYEASSGVISLRDAQAGR